MDTAAVERDLQKRIEQAHALWSNGQPAAFPQLTIRRGAQTYDCSVQLIDMIDDEKRVERYGLMFELHLPAQDPKFTARLEVRIKPMLTEGRKVDSPPYVIVYRAEPRPGKEGSLYWEYFTKPETYKTLVGLDETTWFSRWLQRAARDYFSAVFDRLSSPSGSSQ